MLRGMSVAANRSIEGPIAKSIGEKIRCNLPGMSHFAMYNDSYKHAGHHGIAESDNRIESHFRLEIVSSKFEKMALPKRHRLVFEILDKEMKEIHALQLTVRTPEEQARRSGK